LIRWLTEVSRPLWVTVVKGADLAASRDAASPDVFDLYPFFEPEESK
jgi:hypothetical protein